MSTSTSVEKVKGVSTTELQDALDAADAALTDDVRRRFPILERSTIATRFPNEWVAFFRTTVDDEGSIVGGRLLAHAADPNRLDQLLEPIYEANPDARFFVLTYYTGRDPFGKHFVYV